MTDEKTNNRAVKYYCPYCNTNSIVEFDAYFKCKTCKSKFDKYDFATTEDKSDLLSIGELKGIVKVLKKYKPKDKDLSELFNERDDNSK